MSDYTYLRTSEAEGPLTWRVHKETGRVDVRVEREGRPHYWGASLYNSIDEINQGFPIERPEFAREISEEEL